MRDVKSVLLLIGAIFLASCRLPVSPSPAPPAGNACAILFSESNLDFARTASWTGGPAGYSNLLCGLQAALAAKGVAADLISEAALADDEFTRYRVLYIVDTFSISPEAEEAIRFFVRNGGMLVGVNEVGRFQNGWTKPWHYEDLFGVAAQVSDEFGTALSSADGYYESAQLTPEGQQHPLTRDLGFALSFGSQADAIWVTKPANAVVLAWYPAYVGKRAQKPHASYTAHEPVVALSINDCGKGRAIWIAANMHARNPTNWPAAGATLDVLARCPGLVPPQVSIPRRPPHVMLGLSQIGYAPGERKKAILRVPQEKDAPFSEATYTIRTHPDNTLVREGALVPSGPDNAWHDYLYSADFSDLRTEGTYRFSAHLAGPRGKAEVDGGPFRIATNLWSTVVVPAEYSFLYHYRCGDECHTADPIRGGYHDATGDYAVRMWSMPHVAWCIAENLLTSRVEPNGLWVKPTEELERSVDWLLQMQDANGSVWKSVKPPGDYSPIDTRPDKDTTPRVVEKGMSLNYQTTYVAGMAHAALALRDRNAPKAALALDAARRAHNFLLGWKWDGESTGEVGNYIWGCMELYAASGEKVFLERASNAAPIILSRQFLDSGRAQADVWGDFFDTRDRETFGSRQYKKFHTIGLYFGLIDLARALPDGNDLRRRIQSALDIYFDHSLLRGAQLTPYGEMITALEPDTNALFRIYYFTHLGDWVRLHGLNADHLALGLAALKYDELSPRADLRDFARAQAQWVVGFNPLGFCMIDRMGWTNAPAIDDNVGTGRFLGGIPNGIVGDPHDRPVWGSSWDSREYWLPQNSYLLAIAPRLDAVDRVPDPAPAAVKP